MAFEVNEVATAGFIQAAIRRKVKRFICLSPVRACGDPLADVISEDTSPVPVHYQGSCYGQEISK